ncbi:helix-turn-helix domain-containing protein [Bordetella genomosp. 4]|uniref:HTH cro/C1-type domain-containing protein n=1 Tax=Bordetella genomosp. 4 TaxID=463044 RepID=A0A261TMF6_9BORD|nr:helix-turn-helix transcriptional regulator [Bordetella genomosp. 4]OZI43309.1 hypothetical protein CAL21_21250 [Bordetella genomosp. 4]OZI50846.1 hypothetical protein CAL20_23785 [Bordetella genomosp. 4]
MSEDAKTDFAATRCPQQVGQLLRFWRRRRNLSQLALALEVGVSTRHLSFIETARSKPSADMLLALTERLDVPLRERNQILVAAGYAPAFTQRTLQSPDMQAVQAALSRLLDAHHPYPGFALDRQWNVVQANRAGMALAELLPPFLREPSLNVYRASLHPEGLARFTVNFSDWSRHLLHNLRAAVESSHDTGLQRLEAEVLSYPNVQAVQASRSENKSTGIHALLVPCVLDLPMGRLSLFTTLTTFGTPQDITLQELCIELFYPADAETEALLRPQTIT